jgi:hypothetical protein
LGTYLKDVRPAPFPYDSCGLGSSGCHQEKTAANHAGNHDLLLTQSNYVNSTISGCTNSGNGCHGASTSVNISTYHPNSGCDNPAGACHASTSKPS